MSDYFKKYLKYKSKYLKLKKIVGGSLNEKIKNLIINEPRIINFFSDYSNLSLPEWFDTIPNKKIMLAAGDGYYKTGHNSIYIENKQIINRPLNMPTDIEFMFKLDSYTIFCCHPNYNTYGLEQNINYIKANPEIKVILCLCDLNNDFHCWKLLDLFENKINVINSHDTRLYIPGNIAHKILVKDGYCLNVVDKSNFIYKERLSSEEIQEKRFITEFKWFSKYNNRYNYPYFNCNEVSRKCTKI